MYTLCGKKGCKCPEVEYDNDGNVHITDDYGGHVKLSPEEIKILIEKES